MTSILPGTGLARGEVLPGVPLVEAGTGREIRAWDFRGRSPLVLAFLHSGCAECARYAERLAAAEADVAAAGGRLYAVLQREETFPIPLLVAPEDAVGRLLGEAAEAPTVLVTDRYAAAWESFPGLAHDLPEPSELVDTLWHLATMCEECGIIAWQ